MDIIDEQGDAWGVVERCKVVAYGISSEDVKCSIR
jgi:hypothetical protein